MKWLWITALLFLVTGVKSGPTRNDGDPAVKGNIDKIERTAKRSATERSATASEQFKFTVSGISVSDITMIVLEVTEDETKIDDFYAIDTPPTKTPTFEADLTDYSGKNLNFLTTAKDKTGSTLAFATVDITPFPHFPLVKDTALLKDPRIPEPNNDKLFRVEGTLGDMHLETPPLVAQGGITYYSFSQGASEDNYVPCYKDNDVGVDVCDTELEHEKATCTTGDTTVSSAVLAYGSDGNATIKLTFPDTAAAATYEAILIPQPPPPPQSPEENVLCTDAEFTRATCIIKWSDPSSAVLQLIIIQKTTGQDADTDTWVTSTFDIHDRELVVTNLGDTILEGRWKMLTDEKTYILTKTPGTEGETNSIEVDCSHLADMCFGYFPHVEGGSKGTFYTLTVEPKTKNGNLNQTESVPIEFPAPVQPKLEILSRHTTTHQNQQRADVQICFQHLTPTEGRSFSHYEMLIINEKGQWLKHSLIQEEEEGGDASGERLCFAPFTINTTDFALTEATRVVVSQRAVDGISVLASGESALF